MDASRRRRVEDICDEALRLVEPDRSAYLASACGTEPGLRDDVAALLAHEATARGFLSEPKILGSFKDLSLHGRDLTGTSFGPYTIIGRLGEGGMGVVYRAHDSRLDRDVALKLLASESAGNVERIRNEARTVARLNHPNICTVYDIAAVDGVACIAMELVEGTPLSAAIPNGGFPADRVCGFGRQIAEALAHAHANAVIHRDLKSANVILRSDGSVKVIDFGIAARLPRPTDQTETRQELPSGVAGTLAYLAPEVLAGGAPNAKSDLWSLGVLLFEMATGRLPFAGHNAPKLAAVILRDSYPQLPARLSPRLRTAIEQCLSKDPADRPVNADVVAALLAAEAPRTPQAWPKAMMRRVTAVLAVIAALIGAYFWLRPGTVDRPTLRFGNPRAVTTATGVEEFAAWSPDGKMLAYMASDTGQPVDRWDIYVTPLAGGTPIKRTLDFGTQNRFPSWSPDNHWISFWSDQDGGGCYIMPALAGSPLRISSASLVDPNPAEFSADGNQISCVTGSEKQVMLTTIERQTGAEIGSIELPGNMQRRMFVTRSPDGKQIALVLSPGGLDADVTQLVIYDVATRAVHYVTDGRTKAWSPFWARDGRSLLFVGVSGSTMDLQQQRLTAQGDLDGTPQTLTAGIGMRSAALSADGTKLAYSVGRKVGNVYRVQYHRDHPAKWDEAVPLTSDQASVQCMDLDPTGSTLALSSDRSGSFDLWTMPASGGNLTPITVDPSAEWCPVWSPDGKTFAFFAYRTGNRDVWTVPAAGGEWNQITFNEDADLHPRWTPDGKNLMYLSVRGSSMGVWMSPLDGGADRFVHASNLGGVISPRDLVLAVNDTAGHISLVDVDTDKVLRTFQVQSHGTPSWSPDGRQLIVRSAPDQLAAITVADGVTRPLVDLSNRRGSLNVYGTPTDGKFVYFIWEENFGDIWTMDVRPR